RAGDIPDLGTAAADGCRAFVDAVSQLRHRLDQGTPAAEAARALIADVGLRDDVFAGSGGASAAERRWGNRGGMLHVLARHDERVGQGSTAKLADLLRILTLSPESDDEGGEGNAVTMTTMHGAKGLEFDHVFLAGLEEGLMPHARALDARATDLG